MQPDPEIESLEADLRRSRFEKWDVENFLADRHRAKAEALTKPERVSKWLIFREITDPFIIYVGWVTLYCLFVFWMLDAPPFQ